MMWEYNDDLFKHPASLNYRVRRQKKNLFRRKRVSIYRLKTQGFGFLNSPVLKKSATYFYFKRQKFFFIYSAGLLIPEVAFKNAAKLPASTSFFTALYLNLAVFFNTSVLNFNVNNDKYVVTLNYFNKLLTSSFFFKLFFFKLFFFKLFFFKIKKIANTLT